MRGSQGGRRKKLYPQARERKMSVGMQAAELGEGGVWMLQQQRIPMEGSDQTELFYFVNNLHHVCVEINGGSLQPSAHPHDVWGALKFC